MRPDHNSPVQHSPRRTPVTLHIVELERRGIIPKVTDQDILYRVNEHYGGSFEARQDKNSS